MHRTHRIPFGLDSESEHEPRAPEMHAKKESGISSFGVDTVGTEAYTITVQLDSATVVAVVVVTGPRKAVVISVPGKPKACQA